MRLRTALIRTTLNTTGLLAPDLAGRWALDLWRYPRTRVAVRPAEEPMLRRATRDRVTVAGKETVVYAWGDGRRPVLLTHGWLSRASRLTPLAEALLEAGYSPVTYDAPGCGESEGRETSILEYRELARLLHAEHGRFAAAVGHSVGGLSLFFALRDEVKADRLVSVAAPAEFDYLIDSFCASLGLSDRFKPRLRRGVERQVFPGESDIWRRFSATHRPGELTMPMLLVHDSGDDMIDIGQSRLVVDAYPGQARLMVTRGLGHRRIVSDPDVVRAVVDFVAADRAE
ncbi:alpha/beta fold hydrolase [Streptomyces hainanensis]|uniref:Alpha/beta hydrolase n=1 Tax=Streptomyces hainanensis TaxID=402648 RepID=A0A4R4TAW5_9ACTN|nr:alpha/beta hydrolase [Streptomyces hainanensis]TDC74340.1 alpha/beta hydrolase [Streptomyces hainanensis]